MVLSVYQINNVLRVYKDQLRHSKTPNRSTDHAKPSPDKLSISAEAKRKIIVDKIASDIADGIRLTGPQERLEEEVFKKLENEYGTPMAPSGKGSNDLIFKSIDANGETIKSLSIEDSKFLAHNLHDIARETVDKIKENEMENI
jgi:hypothetical protein